MKKYLALILILLALTKAHAQTQSASVIKPPDYMLGSFEDDYQIRYKITDTLWLQLSNTRFHIIKWNLEKKYIIAKNDAKNPGEGGLYTRIDYMNFIKMEPFLWGF
ncbi:MAG: hypothetical protein ABJA76_09145, partial [Mucilaginibacter sp.]